ncbi:MAG: hypothetical protein ACK59M_05325 [Pseudomonadota bacterium]
MPGAGGKSLPNHPLARLDLSLQIRQFLGCPGLGTLAGKLRLPAGDELVAPAVQRLLAHRRTRHDLRRRLLLPQQRHHVLDSLLNGRLALASHGLLLDG